MEAFIDFSEEENIEDDILNTVHTQIDSIIREIEEHLKDNRCGERLRSGVNVAIIGQPNVGKSSLLNLLCRRPAAIVSPIPGTTRDVVETAVNLGGYPALLSDTAGLRHSDDMIEREGVHRAIDRAHKADISLVVLDALENLDLVRNCQQKEDNKMESIHSSTLRKYLDSYLTPLSVLSQYTISKSNLNESYKETHQSDYMEDSIRTIIVFNKRDLLDDKSFPYSGKCDGIMWCCISCKTEDGLDEFVDCLTTDVKQMCTNSNISSPSLTQSRHRHHSECCHQALLNYINMISTPSGDVVMAAEQIRLAIRHIGKITGKVTSEEILDVIFRDFCIGK